MSAPLEIEIAKDAAVPSSLSFIGRFRTFPIVDFLEVPINIGFPISLNLSRLRNIFKLSFVVFPKPIPGSIIILSVSIPSFNVFSTIWFRL